MSNNFKFEDFKYSIIKEVLYHLSTKDQYNLLICCKKWNKVIMPILFEHIDLNNYRYIKENRRAMHKYGQYIKSLDIKYAKDFPNSFSAYPSCTKLFLPLDLYLKNREKLKHIPSIGVYYMEYIDYMPIEDYITSNEIDITKAFQNLKHFKVVGSEDYLDKSFVELVIPALPSTIVSLNLVSMVYEDNIYFEQLLNRFDNLIVLELDYIELKLEEYNYLLKKQFLKLKQLIIKHIDLEDINYLPDININLNNYPKLEYLHYEAFIPILIFDGVSNLSKLELYCFDLSKLNMSNRLFPNLNQLSLFSCLNVSTNLLHSVFDMSTITNLNLSHCCLSIINSHSSLFLVKEIYPKRKNNIITLKIFDVTLGADFFNYIYMWCPNLYNLEITDCKFNTDIPFSNHKMKVDSNLNNILFTRNNCPNSTTIIDFILENFKNIKSFRVSQCEDFLKAKYFNDPKFYFK